MAQDISTVNSTLEDDRGVIKYVSAAAPIFGSNSLAHTKNSKI